MAAAADIAREDVRIPKGRPASHLPRESPVVPCSSVAPTPTPQRLAARATGSPWFWAVLTGALFALPLVRSLLRQLPSPPPVLGEFPAFSLVDQEGREFTLAGERGRLLVAEFASARGLAAGKRSPLEDLQKRVRETGDAVHLVTFLTGASPFTPAELARRSGAGAWRWTLASGRAETMETLKTLAAGALRIPADRLEGKLLLLDGAGRIRRVTGSSPAEIDPMMRDISLLANLEGRR